MITMSLLPNQRWCFFLRIYFLSSLSVSSVNSDVSDIDRSFFGQVSQDGGYVYPLPPAPPIQLDEPVPPFPPLYLPPSPPIFSDEIPFVPTSNPPATSYLPPPSSYLPPNNDILPPVSNDDSLVIQAQPPQTGGGLYPPSQLSPPLLRIENMSCTQGLNFRATFKMGKESPQFPVVDDATEGCITSASRNTFRIDLENFNSMLKCGVKRCGSGKNEGSENMCVVIRIPTVRGVRLPEDGMVTLMCTPQERVVSQTRHVKLGSSRIEQVSRARSNNAFVATGGTRKELKTRIGIFRKRPGSNSIFDQNVRSDNIIQLGEELMLRATVDEGDGWKSSRVGPVLITGLNSKKSALLVNQQGCVNPAMKSICPKQPIKVNPLSTELRFRAFLFQESPRGDEMVVSVRTQGCLHTQDCTRAEPCNDDPVSRNKRGITKPGNFSSKSIPTSDNSLDVEIKDWESQLSFKVGPAISENNSPIDNVRDHHYHSFLYVSFAGIILSVFVIVLLLFHICCKKTKV